MSDEITEGAKAIQESAKAAGKAVDGLRETGGFFNRIFGDLVEDGVGIIADKVKFYRIEKAVLLAEKTENRLKERGIDATVPVPPKLAIPLIESATLEDDDGLHTLWSNLLANAMDPKTSHQVKHIHASILKEFEPLDANILLILEKEALKQPDKKLSELLFDRAKIAETLNVSEETTDLSFLNLMRLGCIAPGIITGGASMGGHKISSYQGTKLVNLSPLGKSLVHAVQ